MDRSLHLHPHGKAGDEPRQGAIPLPRRPDRRAHRLVTLLAMGQAVSGPGGCGPGAAAVQPVDPTPGATRSGRVPGLALLRLRPRAGLAVAARPREEVADPEHADQQRRTPDPEDGVLGGEALELAPEVGEVGG